MTNVPATATARAGPDVATARRRLPFRRRPGVTEGPAPGVSGGEIPPLSPRLQVVRAALLIVFTLSITLVLQLVVVSRFQQAAAQQQAFDAFRADLAQGTAPVGPTERVDSVGDDGQIESTERQLALGTPVAYLEIPDLGLKQVVSEGTTSGVLFDGPGHRRDTPLPGQSGVSIIMARAAAYGGPFGSIDSLEAGAEVVVTTGQGTYNFAVIGVRREGDPLPTPPAQGESRLLLATADGRPFLPEGVLRVDAELDGEAAPGPPRLYTAANLPVEERFMEGDARQLWALALWLQVLTAIAFAAMWSWTNWGRAQTWVVFLPLLLLVGLAASGEVARLLPNMT